MTSEPFTPGTGDTEPSPRPVVVFGATGGQGGAVVTALLDTSRRVRAVVRDKTSRGAVALAERGIELAQADLSDAAALASAMRGAASAFAVTTPFEAGPEQEVAQGEAIISAAQDARLPHLLFTSVASADRDTGIPHFDSKARIESRLRGGDLEYTIVAPTYFFDNVAGEPAIAQGRLPLALPPDRPLQQIDRSDLGRFAAMVLADPVRHRGRRVELAGDDPTPTQMAAAITEAAGHPVVHDEVPIADVEARSTDLAAMFRFLAERGYDVDISSLREAHPEIGWSRFAEWAKRRTWPS